SAMPQAGALVGSFHDSGTGTRDDREACLREQPRDLGRVVVLRVVRACPCRAEHGHALLDRGECVEALDELTRYAEDAPRVGPREVIEPARLLQELLVLRHDGIRTANGVVDLA